MQWKTPICLRHFEFEHITYREPGNWNPKRQPHRTGGNSPPILRLFTQAHQAPTELEVWLTAIVYIPWIFFCWRPVQIGGQIGTRMLLSTQNGKKQQCWKQGGRMRGLWSSSWNEYIYNIYIIYI